MRTTLTFGGQNVVRCLFGMEQLAEELNASHITDLDEAKAYAEKFLADKENVAGQEAVYFVWFFRIPFV